MYYDGEDMPPEMFQTKRERSKRNSLVYFKEKLTKELTEEGIHSIRQQL